MLSYQEADKIKAYLEDTSYEGHKTRFSPG